ncbi:UNVERIFIED_CONTAM: hypothetical protein Sradi_1412500 [Sesamum radiatum]|uniref:Uncharacterized protein n=1 Tax=Sesamum radiatum TaxID=300843 RepID=A0AAW2UT01_SESRA
MADERSSKTASSEAHKHTNRLAEEHSPYLLQHAHNPVDREERPDVDKVEDILGEHAPLFKEHYYVKSSGNCDLSRMSDPHNEFKGKNVLIERNSTSEMASKFGMSMEEYLKTLGICRKKLFDVRSKRPRPHLDDKAVFEKRLKDTVMAVPLMCCAADMFSIPSRKQVVVVGPKSSPEYEGMLAAAHASYDPSRTVIHIDPTDAQEMRFWEENNDKIALMAKNNFSSDKVVALVCQDFTCNPPVYDPSSLKSLLSK